MFHCHAWVVVALCLALTLYATHVQGGQWYPGGFCGHFQFKCEKGDSLHAIFSVFHKQFADRRYFLHCNKTPYPPELEMNATVCGPTDDAQNRHGKLTFGCPSPYYVAGLDSVFLTDDRRFTLTCCEKLGIAGIGSYCATWASPESSRKKGAIT